MPRNGHGSSCTSTPLSPIIKHNGIPRMNDTAAFRLWDLRFRLANGVHRCMYQTSLPVFVPSRMRDTDGEFARRMDLSLTDGQPIFSMLGKDLLEAMTRILAWCRVPSCRMLYRDDTQRAACYAYCLLAQPETTTQNRAIAHLERNEVLHADHCDLITERTPEAGRFPSWRGEVHRWA